MASNRKWWLLGGAGCFVFGLLLTIGVVLVILSFVRTVSSPKQTAEKFYSSLQHKNYSKAWDLLSPELQEEYGGYNDFKAFFKGREPVQWQIRSTQVVNDKAIIEVSITSKGTGWEALVHYPSKLFLRKAEGKWKIYQIKGSGQPSAKKPDIV